MFLNILMALALLTVLGTLILGMLNMRNTGEEARQKSNTLMRWRVGSQLVAFAILALAIYLKQNSGS